MDGDAFKRHKLFSVNKKALQIFFYYDDLEVVNPLGSKAKIHKLSKSALFDLVPMDFIKYMHVLAFRHLLLFTGKLNA